jgi:hypothetical protein
VRRSAAAGGGASLRGRIADADNAPLAGALVTVRNALDGREHSALTHADGSFAFPDLPAGLYDLEARLDGYGIPRVARLAVQGGDGKQLDITAAANTDTVTVGVIMAASEPLRRAFSRSDVVVVATVGASHERAVGRDGMLDVTTELVVETVFKGTVDESRLRYRHAEYAGDGEEGVVWRDVFAPGRRVLALLQREGDAAGEAGIFESADAAFGVKPLDDAARASYAGRLEALARLERRAERRGERDPEGIVDWLVATAEDRHTRREATAELGEILHDLDRQAQQSETTTALAARELLAVLARFQDEGGRLEQEPPSVVLAAHVTAEHRSRLAAALVATHGLSRGDRELYWLVRGWDRRAADAWLLAQVVRPVADEDEEEVDWMLQSMVDESGPAALQALVEAAEARQEEIEALWPDDESQQTEALREERAKVVRAELRQELARTLAAAAPEGTAP